jgi:hypothetical protein
LTGVRWRGWVERGPAGSGDGEVTGISALRSLDVEMLGNIELGDRQAWCESLMRIAAA